MKVTAEERRARQLLRDRSSGLCEVCFTAQATDWSHRKRRSQGGRWCPSNGLHVCRSDHRRIDSEEPSANYRGWHLKSWQDPETTPAYLARHGWVLLGNCGEITPTNPPQDDAGSAA